MTIKVFSVAEMVAAEKAADAAGHSYGAMMEIAGRRVAEAMQQRYEVSGSHVLVLVGPGNNGGDGLVAGRYLAEAGANVSLYLFKQRDPHADENLARVVVMGLEIVLAEDDQRYRLLQHRLRSADYLVDALLGTGVSRPITGPLAALMQQVKATVSQQAASSLAVGLISLTSLPSPDETPPGPISHLPIIAIDCPSGLNTDSGALDPLTLAADLTVTFAGPKRGHFLFPGAAAVGELVVADIGIDPALKEIDRLQVEVATPDEMHRLLPDRPAEGHKGTFGTALIAAGSIRYWGAPALAARGAFRIGAGLVTLAVPQRLRPALAGQFPEATYPPVTDTDLLGVSTANLLLSSLKTYDAILVGPGLGEAGSFLQALLDGLREPVEPVRIPPLIVDADGLNLLAGMENWPTRLPPGTILTPHPGEMGRLIHRPKEVLADSDRIELAREKAIEWGHIVVLKGAYTVIAGSDGRTTILPFANPILSVGGSGDVLAGVIAGLLAQAVPPYQAAVLGGYLHGAAGQLAAGYWGNAGLLASELADWIPHARRSLLNQPA